MNGAAVISSDQWRSAFPGSLTELKIMNKPGGQSIRDYMDELRISNVARYPSSGGFTPPTNPFSLD